MFTAHGSGRFKQILKKQLDNNSSGQLKHSAAVLTAPDEDYRHIMWSVDRCRAC